LQQWQHYFYNGLERAARELSDEEKEVLSRCIHQRTLIELMPGRPPEAKAS
jgi:hypothetical protein